MESDFGNAIKTFNHHNTMLMQNPYPFYDEARSKCPAGHSDELGGYYFFTRFDSVKQILSDFRSFSSAEGDGLPAPPVQLLPINIDPPEHTKYRKILNPWFSPERAAMHRSRIERIVNRLIDGFIGKGEAELVDGLFRPVLWETFLPIMGVPRDDVAMIAEKLDYTMRYRMVDLEGCAHRHEELASYLMGVAARRRIESPQDDILQNLIHSKVNGEPLSDDQIFRVLLILLYGAVDTTASALAESLLYLARNPAEAARLRDGTIDYATAVEEFIRYSSPGQGMRRTVTREIEVDGQTLKPGDVVFALNAAANRDPAHFAEASQCVMERHSNDHLAFGAGAHICLGRYFARLVMEVVIEAVLTRLPDFKLLDDFVPIYAVGETRYMKAEPIRFAPGRPMGA